MLESVGLGVVQKKDTMFSGFHKLIKLPDTSVPFSSLRCILGKLEVILLLPWHSSLLMNHIDGVAFWANWCDGGE